MKTQTKHLTGLAVATVLVLTGLVAPCVRAEETPRNDAVEQFITEKLANNENLTSDQRTKVVTTMRTHLPALQKVAKQFATEQKALLETLAPAAVEEKTIRDQATKLGDVLVSYAKQRATVVKGLREILTQEQLDKAGQGPKDVDTLLARFVDEIAKQLARE